MPDDPGRSPSAVLTLADDYLAAGRPFAAHEVLEGAWKHRPAEERDGWQGLAQVAVGLTHLQRGNQAGAIALLRRGAERLDRTERPDRRLPGGPGGGSGHDDRRPAGRE